jgi:hypothetical protein
MPTDTSTTNRDTSTPSRNDSSGGGTMRDGMTGDEDMGGSGLPCFEDAGNVSMPSCSEPSSCPAPDNAKDPTLTCHEPNRIPGLENTTIHIYGRHLVNENGPPQRILYRDVDTTGPSGKSTEDITVVSDCHIKAELKLKFTGLQCGDKIEFQLQRKKQRDAKRDVGGRGIISDWRHIYIVR